MQKKGSRTYTWAQKSIEKVLHEQRTRAKNKQTMDKLRICYIIQNSNLFQINSDVFVETQKSANQWWK